MKPMFPSHPRYLVVLIKDYERGTQIIFFYYYSNFKIKLLCEQFSFVAYSYYSASLVEVSRAVCQTLGENGPLLASTAVCVEKEEAKSEKTQELLLEFGVPQKNNSPVHWQWLENLEQVSHCPLKTLAERLEKMSLLLFTVAFYHPLTSGHSE